LLTVFVTINFKETTMKMWKVFRGHSVITLGLLGSVLVFASLANATLLTPGNTVAPSAIVVGAGSTTEVSLGPTAFSAATFAGTVSEWVVSDTSTGDLDFIYQVTETSATSGIATMSVTNYSNTTNNVGTTTGYGAAGTINPTTISETATGGAINFNFGASMPLGTTVDLIVQTNATSYAGGGINFIDGSVASVSGYGPAPEPGSVGLLLGGLFGLGLFVTRRFRVQQS
jgi:hypothetical protein